MYLQMQITMLLTAVNIILLCGIIALNARSYVRLRAQYTVFLMVFAGLFLVQHLVSGYFFLTMMEFYALAVATHVMVLTGLQTIAFAALVWMEWQ